LSPFRISFILIEGVYNRDMPPQSSIPKDELLLPPGHKSGAGGLVGIIIIIVLLMVGALYFWGAHLNNQSEQSQVPYIPADNSTSTNY